MPLRVGIDLSARLPVATGVDNYLEQLVLALLRVAEREAPGGFRFLLFLARGDQALERAAAAGAEIVVRCPRPRIARLGFQQLALPVLARRLELDVLHSPSFVMPWWRGRAGHVLTVYDTTIFSLARMHNTLHRSAAYRLAVGASMRRADVVTVPSAWVRAEIERTLPRVDPDKVVVTRPGVSAEFSPRPSAEIEHARERLGLRSPYVLYTGTLEPRKNLTRLVVAFDRLVKEGAREELVLAGRYGWGCRSLFAEIRARGLEERVRVLGYVDRELLPALTSGARAFVYPSLHEGFGFPPLEAMACGVPTVAGANSSLLENLDGAAELVDGRQPAALADALHRVLTDEAVRCERRRLGLERAAGFDWDDTARRTLDVYRRAARSARGGVVS